MTTYDDSSGPQWEHYVLQLPPSRGNQLPNSEAPSSGRARESKFVEPARSRLSLVKERDYPN